MNNLLVQKCFLVDNGSLRPASTLALRRVAAALSKQLGREIVPASLLHSNRVSTTDLEGNPAKILETELRSFAESSGERALVLPLFFGPSGALVDYIPERVESLVKEFPQLRVSVAGSLESPSDDSAELIADALCDEINRVYSEHTLETPTVIVTDHGTPLPSVSAVRNRVGEALSRRSNLPVRVASMERREGSAFDFNEPLLETALKEIFNAGCGDVVVALQFLFSGRHAGPDGDVAEICQRVSSNHDDVRTWMTNPIGESPQILKLLERRFQEAVNRWSSIR
ncbi:MAG: hypothetical protein SynsKO_17450 [Synoicihabitans sp.]